jgi:uncharacterized membrane protein
MAASFLVSSLTAPGGRGAGLRLAAGAAVLTVCIFVYLIDKAILSSCASAQVKRIERSNLCSATLLLYPFASRAAPGSLPNLVLDTTLYCGAVFFLAGSIASRLEPLLTRKAVPYGKIVRWTFPVIVAGYLVIVGTQLAASFASYRTEWVDFSFEFAPVWQSVRYGLFRLIDEFSRETTSLAGHAPYIYLVLSPLTLLWNSPKAVLWISTSFFALGAYAVYVLSKHHSGNKTTGALIGSLYLLYLPVHLANLYDFHSDPLAVPFMFLSFLFAARRQWRLFGIMMASALACKEYVGLAYAGYGAWISGKNKKAGLLIATVGLLWFVVAVKAGAFFAGPLGAGAVLGANYGAIGGDKGVAGVLGFCLAHPAVIIARLFRANNMVSLLSILLPFLFLPLKKPWLLAAGFLIPLKDALSESGIELLSHRETLFLPFVVYAFILYISNVTARKRRYMLIAVSIAVTATFMLQGHAFPSRGFWLMRSEYAKSRHDRVCDTMLARIPADAPVMASSHLTSHLLQRKWYFLFPRFPTPVEPEYIVVDTLEQAGWNWLTRTEHQEGFARIRNSKEYNLTEEQDGVFIFKKAGN